MVNLIFNNGCVVMMCNCCIGVVWLVSFDYCDGSYWYELQGNLCYICWLYVLCSIELNLVLVGMY